MLRSAVTTVCRLRGCLPQLQHSIDSHNGVGVGVSRRWLGVTGAARVLDRDHQAKKAKDNTRHDDLTSVPDVGDDQIHSVNFSSMFPSVETHSMLINNTRFDELPTIHVKATHNNTIIMVTDGKGVPLAHESGGTVGFRNSRKGTNIAAQAAAIALAQKATKKGIDLVRVSVKGIGPGRLPAIKGLQMSGLTVVSITDATPLPHNGHRPKKQRRV